MVYIYKHKLDLSFIEVRPGDLVVIKPNLVKEFKENDHGEWECVITSGALIEQVCEHVCALLAGRGEVVVCDAPQTDSSFDEIVSKLRLRETAERCEKKYGVPVRLLDLRLEEWRSEQGIVVSRRSLPGDPRGTVRFDLGSRSLFYGHLGEGKYYGADYDSSVVNDHHRGLIQEYLVCATPILADVFINLPKLKTHKKTGVTLSLKNLVGINADKNWLPHHTCGSPNCGGDQFPDISLLRRCEQSATGIARRIALGCPVLGPFVAKALRRVGTVAFGEGDRTIRSGNWYGNDTTWRMVLDLNRCLLYGAKDGTLDASRRKRYYTLIDGVVGMEGLGPMQGDPVRSNVVIGGTDPVAVDMVAAHVMGFDWRKIPVIREATRPSEFPISWTSPEKIFVSSDVSDWNGAFASLEAQEFYHFVPHFGWKGHIEHEEGTQ